MEKILFYFTVCLVIGLTIADKGKDQFHFKHKDLFDFDRKSMHSNKKFDNICADPDAAQGYLKQILSVIDNLEANSTYTTVLQNQSTNFLRYIKDTTNQNLLKNDCEAFFQGLKSARKADKDQRHAQDKLNREIQKQLKQAIKDISKGKKFLELDI